MHQLHERRALAVQKNAKWDRYYARAFRFAIKSVGTAFGATPNARRFFKFTRHTVVWWLTWTKFRTGKIPHLPSKNEGEIPHQDEIRNFPRGKIPPRNSPPPPLYNPKHQNLQWVNQLPKLCANVNRNVEVWVSKW